MTNNKLNGIIRNPRTTESYLKNLSISRNLTEEQVLLMLNRDYKDSTVVVNLFYGYKNNPKIVLKIITRASSFSALFVRRLGDFLVVNPHCWLENEWQPVMDAFKKLIASRAISSHSNLCYFSYSECENKRVIYPDDFDTKETEHKSFYFFS